MSDATTILLIDGEPQTLDYYSQHLHASSSHCDVVQADTGRSGLEICARQPIDCVVLEIDLPDMSGFEVLAKLVPRTYRPEIPVIVLTRLHNDCLLDLAIRNGAQGAFFKSTTSGEHLDKIILRAISTVQAFRRRVTELTHHQNRIGLRIRDSHHERSNVLRKTA
jgi:DNA-binding NarL/FixJ family response regulator